MVLFFFFTGWMALVWIWNFTADTDFGEMQVIPSTQWHVNAVVRSQWDIGDYNVCTFYIFSFELPLGFFSKGYFVYICMCMHV